MSRGQSARVCTPTKTKISDIAYVAVPVVLFCRFKFLVRPTFHIWPSKNGIVLAGALLQKSLAPSSKLQNAKLA